MKFSSVLTKLLLLNLLIIFVATDDVPEFRQNQNYSYPNTYEAATSPKQLVNIKYALSKLSNSLDEVDPSRKLKRSEFLTLIHFAQYQITRGESEQIFYFADQNRDDLVDNREFTEFKALFLLPFEACNTNGSYLLSRDELKVCFEADPRSSYVQFRRRYNEDDVKYDLMRQLISSRAGGDLNFADYLFLRKALFGWKECHSTPTYISKYQFKCALAASLPQKYYTELDTDIIYDSGIRIFGDRALIQNDFISYLGILYYTYVFGTINTPVHSAFMEKAQWLKAVREDRIPNNFDEMEIEKIFELIGGNPYQHVKKVTTIDFPSWIWFFNLNRLFNNYSSTRPSQINLEEFRKMCNDTFIQRDILISIDNSLTRFQPSHYQEASLILQKLRPHEKNFFYSFKQDASRASYFSYNNSTNHTFYQQMVTNETNREVFFSIMTDVDKEYVNKTNLYRAFQMANFFNAIGGFPGQMVAPSIAVDYLQSQGQKLYEKIRPPISMTQRTNAGLYKLIPNELKLDLLTYLCVESFFWKFKVPSNSYRNIISETDLKVILKDFGMDNMPFTVIDTAQKGVDALKRREYIPLQAIKAIITVQAVASEQMRDKMQFFQLGILNSTDPSRLHPQPERRFLSSPFV